ncbi:hypothetical protein Srot_0256 [Segniliparus rotundus DSM 44985]|uniref:Uncharacterized protein n=1 Tax=Segniliparus rotundus (strain ATCC BAA-972 / CDC 1076 / CIP 108378 / DSM 44985 / JCM 13578) TaxID=640132 RepID=D6ZAY4_SEGRD|nr:hypothetical protein [Segniliparus rotundus]ADG96743.1 hypothetical protein Srot_0256 [Segniliparus rotundus DSM 44985]
MAHPLEMVSPVLAGAVKAVPKEKAPAVAAGMARAGVSGASAYTQGQVWGPLYGALANNGEGSGTGEFAAAREAAKGELRSHELDGMELLARLEGRVPAPVGDAPPTRGEYENHRNLTWRLRAMLTALEDPYPEQLLDIAHCLHNGGMNDTDITQAL